MEMWIDADEHDKYRHTSNYTMMLRPENMYVDLPHHLIGIYNKTTGWE
jgi:hypothetical protein